MARRRGSAVCPRKGGDNNDYVNELRKLPWALGFLFNIIPVGLRYLSKYVLVVAAAAAAALCRAVYANWISIRRTEPSSSTKEEGR